MKKTLPYLIGLLAIAAITFWVLHKDKTTGNFSADADIIVKDPKDVQKIFLVDMNGKSVTLQNKNTYWSLNDSFKARPDAIDNLLMAITHQVVSQSVPAAAKPFIMKSLSTDAVKVEVYNQANKKISCFYVGGETKDGGGSYMLKDGASEPFVYNIPGFPNGLTSRFFTSAQDWRAREALCIAEDDIQEIAINYVEHPDSNYSIIKQGNTFSLRSKYTFEPKLGKIQQYIKKFNPMYCAGFENEMEGKDSIIKHAPLFATIAIKQTNGKQQVLHLLYHEITQRTKNGKQANGFTYDPDFMYAYNDKDFMVLAASNFENLFRSPVSFY